MSSDKLYPMRLPSVAAIIALGVVFGTMGFFFMIVFCKHYATETIVTQVIQVLSSALNFVLGFYFGGMYVKKKMDAERAAELSAGDVTTTTTTSTSASEGN